MLLSSAIWLKKSGILFINRFLFLSMRLNKRVKIKILIVAYKAIDMTVSQFQPYELLKPCNFVAAYEYLELLFCFILHLRLIYHRLYRILISIPSIANKEIELISFSSLYDSNYLNLVDVKNPLVCDFEK